MNTYLTQLIQALFATKKAYEKRIDETATELAMSEPESSRKECIRQMKDKGYCEHMSRI